MDRLAELRERRGLTLRELSKTSGVSPDTINQIELGHRKARPSTLRKLARALEVDIKNFFEDEELTARPKVESAPPLDFEAAGPTLLEKGLDAARHDEEKDLRAIDRLIASEGTPQVTHSYEEDEFRVTLRERGYPDEDFESFVWPLIVMARRAELLEQLLEQESARAGERPATRRARTRK